MSRRTLVLGGARSGKSRFAEGLTKGAGKRTYIATAETVDDEMRERIAKHRDERGQDWTTREAPLELAAALSEADARDGVVLIDCITVWLGNLCHHGRDVSREVDRLCETIGQIAGDVVVVANEVGLGIVPDNPMARHFRDEAGRANQKIAAIADEVIFVAAGIPLVLKGEPRRRSSQRRASSAPVRKA